MLRQAWGWLVAAVRGTPVTPTAAVPAADEAPGAGAGAGASTGSGTGVLFAARGAGASAGCGVLARASATATPYPVPVACVGADAAAATEQVLAAVVVDGFGQPPAGPQHTTARTLASVLAQQLLASLLRPPAAGTDAIAPLLDSFAEADFAIQAGGFPGATGAGCVVAVVRPTSWAIANVGNDVAVVGGRDGSARVVSFAHVAEHGGERARHISAGARVFESFGTMRVEGMLALSRAFGVSSLRNTPAGACLAPVPHVLTAPRSDNDELLLLASERVVDAFPSPAALVGAARTQLALAHGHVDAACQQLLRQAQAHMHVQAGSIAMIVFDAVAQT